MIKDTEGCRIDGLKNSEFEKINWQKHITGKYIKKER